MSRLISRPKPLSKSNSNSKMTYFILYGSRGSTNTNRVRLTLAEAGFADYELKFIDLQQGEQKVDIQFFHARAVSICN